MAIETDRFFENTPPPPQEPNANTASSRRIRGLNEKTAIAAGALLAIVVGAAMMFYTTELPTAEAIVAFGVVPFAVWTLFVIVGGEMLREGRAVRRRAADIGRDRLRSPWLWTDESYGNQAVVGRYLIRWRERIHNDALFKERGFLSKLPPVLAATAVVDFQNEETHVVLPLFSPMTPSIELATAIVDALHRSNVPEPMDLRFETAR
jgi:hypothetical protein